MHKNSALKFPLVRFMKLINIYDKLSKVIRILSSKISIENFDVNVLFHLLGISFLYKTIRLEITMHIFTDTDLEIALHYSIWFIFYADHISKRNLIRTASLESTQKFLLLGKSI